LKKQGLFWIVCVAIIVGGFLTVKYFNREYLIKSEITVNSERWNKLIANELNINNVKLSVDGVAINNNNKKIYVDENLKMYIPVDIIGETFNCFCGIYKDKNVKIKKGENELDMKIDSNIYTWNGTSVEAQQSIIEIEDMYYYPVDILAECLHYTYVWDGLYTEIKLVNDNNRERILPYYFSYEDEGRSPTVRSQGNYSTCWAFASVTALESTLLPEERKVFAADHMAIMNSYNTAISDGGDYNISMAYLSAWQGPVLEKDDKYDGVSGKYKVAKHVQEMQIIESKDYETIKSMVYKYGAVQSALYTSLINSSSVSNYYNKEKAAYCYIGENKPNHDIVIIGWDDNYPKENFTTDVEGNGAFICRNSWGKEFGKNGNFYVSYYDSNIGVHNIVYTKIENTNNYDNIYQTDLCGFVGKMGFKEKNTAYFANVYKAKKNEAVKAVGFYATDNDTKYEVFVCPDYTGENSLTTGRTWVGSGNVKNKGFYTVNFGREIEVEEGKEFAVIVKATTPNSTEPVAVEFANDEITKNVDITDGKGYISFMGNSWENVEKNKKCNICLKAYTDNR